MEPDIDPRWIEVTKESLPRIVEEVRRETAEVLAAGIREFIAEISAETGRKPVPGLEAALLEKAMAMFDKAQAPHIAQIERTIDGSTLQ